jgi:hypothetical protein
LEKPQLYSETGTKAGEGFDHMLEEIDFNYCQSRIKKEKPYNLTTDMIEMKENFNQNYF